MDLGVAAIFIPIGLVVIIFNRPLVRSARKNMSRFLPWYESDRDFRIESILFGIIFIIMGLFGSFNLL